jgi:hypothetical protein
LQSRLFEAIELMPSTSNPSLTLLLVSSVFAAVIASFGWAVLEGPDACEGSMQVYVKSITVVSSIELAAYLTGVVLALSTQNALVLLYNALLLCVGGILGNLLNFAFFLWGAVALMVGGCRGTGYWLLTAILVVLNALSLGSSILSRNRAGRSAGPACIPCTPQKSYTFS